MTTSASKSASIGRINQVRAIIKDTVPVTYESSETQEIRHSLQKQIAEKSKALREVSHAVEEKFKFDHFRKVSPVPLERDQYDELTVFGLSWIQDDVYHHEQSEMLHEAVAADSMCIQLKDEIRQLQQSMHEGTEFPQRMLLIRAGQAKTESDLEQILTDAKKYALSGGSTRA